ncbi:hypothetical protein APHAL10511_000749 [Amanita phalloides]|nr:hypothetical protein APHAL10511_000749 [Amanita phalloides]
MFSTRGFIFILLLSLSVAGAPPNLRPSDYFERPGGRPTIPPGMNTETFQVFDLNANMETTEVRTFRKRPGRRQRTSPQQPKGTTRKKAKTSAGKPSDKPPPAHNKPVEHTPPGKPSDEPPPAHNKPVEHTSPGKPSDEPPAAHNKPVAHTSSEKPSDEPPPAHNKPVEHTSPGKPSDEPPPDAHVSPPPDISCKTPPPGLPMTPTVEPHDHSPEMWLLKYCRSRSGSPNSHN